MTVPRNILWYRNGPPRSICDGQSPSPLLQFLGGRGRVSPLISHLRSPTLGCRPLREDADGSNLEEVSIEFPFAFEKSPGVRPSNIDYS